MVKRDTQNQGPGTPNPRQSPVSEGPARQRPKPRDLNTAVSSGTLHRSVNDVRLSPNPNGNSGRPR